MAQSSDLKLPNPPAASYETIPPFDQLRLMSYEDLKQVENFTISNEHGSIHFFGRTDLTDLDLAKLIRIEATQVDVYPEGTSFKDAVGEKLNKEALVTLFGGVKPKKGQTP